MILAISDMLFPVYAIERPPVRSMPGMASARSAVSVYVNASSNLSGGVNTKGRIAPRRPIAL